MTEPLARALEQLGVALTTRWSCWTVVVRQADRTLPFAQFDPTTTTPAGGKAQWVDANEYDSILSDATLHRNASDKAVVELWSGVERGLRLHVGDFVLPLSELFRGKRAAATTEFTGGAFVFTLKTPAAPADVMEVVHARYLRVRAGVRGIDRTLLMRLNTFLAQLLAMQSTTDHIDEARRAVSLALSAKRKYDDFIEEHRTAA